MVDTIIMLIARWATDFILFFLMMQVMANFWIVDYPLSVTWGNIPIREPFSKVEVHWISMNFLMGSRMNLLAITCALSCF